MKLLDHHCHATKCPQNVPREMWGCKKHWFMISKSTRNEIWKYYRPGQCDDLNPSKEYLLAARKGVIEVALKENIPPDTSLYDLFLRNL